MKFKEDPEKWQITSQSEFIEKLKNENNDEESNPDEIHLDSYCKGIKMI